MMLTAAMLSSLSMIESSDDDYAVGASGELSRFQIKSDLWQERAAGRNPRDPEISSRVASEILQARINQFIKTNDRQPSMAETYRLWNPKCREETAQCYANLCAREDHQPAH